MEPIPGTVGRMKALSVDIPPPFRDAPPRATRIFARTGSIARQR
jgi:hypothetical protein